MGFIATEMDRGHDSAASDIVRRRLAPKGGIIIISKRNNPTFRRREGRTARAKGILKTLKAFKAMDDKVDSKAAEQIGDLAVKPKRAGMKKLPTNIIERIKFGKRLMRKRKNKRWNYNPAKEPDENVDLYFDEENDEDVDEDDDEYWYDENEEHPDGWGPWFMCLGGEYNLFNASKRRLYSVRLERGGLEREELRNWLQRTMDRIAPGTDNRYLLSYPCGFIMAQLSEEEADAIAGLDDVLYVEPS